MARLIEPDISLTEYSVMLLCESRAEEAFIPSLRLEAMTGSRPTSWEQ